MNPRKRLASDTQFPTNSAKYSRTACRHNPGGNTDGLKARWMVHVKETFKLAGETVGRAVAHVMNPYSNGAEEYTTAADYASDSPPLSPPPVDRIPAPCPPSNTHMRNHKLHTGPAMSMAQSPNLTSQVQETTASIPVETPLIPSTGTVTCSTPLVPSSIKFPIIYPKSNQEAQQALTVLKGHIQSSPKGYKARPHILEHVHKAKVKAQKIKDRKEMVEELYRLRRKSGYKSDFSTFQSFLSYRARLELLERREALAPSPSLTDLRSKALTGAPSRRHSFSYDSNWLERALAKARKTQNEPKPPQAFAPAIDKLGMCLRGKDQEIEQRLRPTSKPLPSELPPADEVKVKEILAKRGVISKHAREQVTDKDLSRLRPGQWLNDEIINFYGSMILARSEESKENPVTNGVVPGKGKPLNAHYFNTFFWSKLSGEGYDKARLAKWTKKFDLFSKDVILIPINHHNSHWTGAAINFRRKRIESYDSMNMDRRNVFKHLRSYLDAEHRNKKKKPFDFDGWVNYTLEDTPQQENGFDCGVFTCQFLESLSRGEETFNFTQANMPYLRRRMVWEIGHAQLRGCES